MTLYAEGCSIEKTLQYPVLNNILTEAMQIELLPKTAGSTERYRESVKPRQAV